MLENVKKKYHLSPLVEVMCEFVFESESKLDSNKIAFLNEQYKQEFPFYEEFILESYTISPDKRTKKKIVASKNFYRYLNSDKSLFLQFSSDLFTINKLQPYEGWEMFKPLIKDNLIYYINKTNPSKIKSIRLKYINIIKINDFNENKVMIKLEDYLNFYPKTPNNSRPIRHFQVNTVTPYKEDNTETLNLFSHSLSSDIDFSIILDLEYKLTQVELINLDSIDILLERAHEIIEENFELCLTDKSRILFKEAI